MAMRRRPGGSWRRGRRSRNRPRWAADFATFSPATGALAQQNILSEVDFGTSTGLESECLLHRIILSGVVSTSVTGVSTLGLGVLLMNENVTPTFGAVGDPNTVDSLVDDDWLYTRDCSVGEEAQGNWGFIDRVYADIRVKRKIRSNDVLRLVLSNAAGGVAVTSTFMVRMLVSPRL